MDNESAIYQTLVDITHGKCYLALFSYPFESDDDALQTVQTILDRRYVENYELRHKWQIVADDRNKPTLTPLGRAYLDSHNNCVR